MRFKFLIFALVFFVFPLVSAYNVEVTLNSNIENFNTLVYKCSDSTCAQTSFYDLVNSGTKVNKYALIGSGEGYYVEYDYKTCLAPHIYINKVWDPYKNNEAFSIFFSKKQDCKGTINTGSLSENEINLGEGVSMNSNVQSAFSYPSNIPKTLSIPDSIKDEYSSETKVEFYANDVLIHSIEEEILMDQKREFEFNWKPNEAGTYEIKVKTTIIDCACQTQNTQELVLGVLKVNEEPQCIPNIIFTPWTAWQNVTQCRIDNTILQRRTRIEYDANTCGTFQNVTHEEFRNVNCIYEDDETAPSSVTNLRAIDKSKNWILWNWTNPTETDFYQNIVYIDGINVANTTNNFYNASGLNSKTYYTITIHTKDFSGNINNTDVSNTAKTLEELICVPNIILTPWTAWQNVTQCRIDNTTLQRRTRTEYDSNNCGIVQNITHEEFREISCIYQGEDDETAPSTITNLHVIDKSYTWILWGWTNPNEVDFYQNIVYIDGINVANTSNSYYNASGLNSNTYYTITVHTIDFSGNINNTDVSNAARTLKETEEEEEKEKKDRKTVIENAPIFFLEHNLTAMENVTIRLDSFSSIEEKESLNWFWILLLILAILIILILIIYVVYYF